MVPSETSKLIITSPFPSAIPVGAWSTNCESTESPNPGFILFVSEVVPVVFHFNKIPLWEV